MPATADLWSAATVVALASADRKTAAVLRTLGFVIGARGGRVRFADIAALGSGLLLRPTMCGHLTRFARHMTTHRVPRNEALRTSAVPAGGF